MMPLNQVSESVEKTVPLLHLVDEQREGLKIAAPPRKPLEAFAHLVLGDGHLTLSYYQDENDNIVCGVAFAAPNDNFCRAKGRNLSKLRRTHDGDWNGYRFTYVRNRDMRFGEQLRREVWKFLNALAVRSNYQMYAGSYTMDEQRNKTMPRWVMNELRRMGFDSNTAEEKFVKGD